jgi:hypothetical protein
VDAFFFIDLLSIACWLVVCGFVWGYIFFGQESLTKRKRVSKDFLAQQSCGLSAFFAVPFAQAASTSLQSIADAEPKKQPPTKSA